MAGRAGGGGKLQLPARGALPPWDDAPVYTLHCTGKLLKRLGPVTEVTREPPTTVLGDWYGTLVYAPGMQLCS